MYGVDKVQINGKKANTKMINNKKVKNIVRIFEEKKNKTYKLVQISYLSLTFFPNFYPIKLHPGLYINRWKQYIIGQAVVQ